MPYIFPPKKHQIKHILRNQITKIALFVLVILCGYLMVIKTTAPNIDLFRTPHYKVNLGQNIQCYDSKKHHKHQNNP